MNFKTLATAACLSLTTATASYAAPIDFNFSFTDGTNTITGLIEGLVSDGAGQMASQISVNGVLDDYIFTSFINNHFDVVGGVIDETSVDVFASGQGLGNVADYLAEFRFLGRLPVFSLIEEPIFDTNPSARTDSRSLTFTQVAAVPLPAAGLLLLSGVAGFAGLKRRKKRAA